MQDFTDPDLLAIGVRPRGRFPVARVLLVITLLAAAVFVGAAYLPLHSAHQKLAVEYDKLAKDSRTVTDELKRTQQELQTVTDERKKLAATVSASDEKQKSVSDALSTLQQKVESALTKRVAAHQAEILTVQNTVVVRIPRAVMFSANSLKLMRSGALLLCEVGRALTPGESSVTVSAHSDSEEVPAPLAKTYQNAWDVSAAEASAAAAALTGQCKFTASRVTAAAHGNSAPLEGADPKDNARIELVLQP